jgi:hypothetical protein
MSNTVQCSQCGADTPADAQFCTNCGAALPAVSSAGQPTKTLTQAPPSGSVVPPPTQLALPPTAPPDPNMQPADAQSYDIVWQLILGIGLIALVALPRLWPFTLIATGVAGLIWLFIRGNRMYAGIGLIILVALSGFLLTRAPIWAAAAAGVVLILMAWQIWRWFRG